MYCGRCGTLVPEGSIYCLKCGLRLGGPPIDHRKFRNFGLLSMLLGAVFIALSIYGAVSSQIDWVLWWRAFFFGVLISFSGAVLGIYARLIGKDFFGSIGFYMNLVGYPIFLFPVFAVIAF